jgi:DNA-binding transcriptional ArsR family regulator
MVCFRYAGAMTRYDDPRILRAIAHPTRNRVLHELTAVGPLRAADVAARLDIPANQASFHLRQLAKYGLIEEAPEASSDRRDRVWQAVDPHGLTFSTREMARQPGGPAAVKVFRRSAEAHAHELVASAYREQPEGEATGSSISEYTILLDPDRARRLDAELQEVLQRYVSSGREDSQDPSLRSWSYFAMLQPLPAPQE